MSIVGIENAGGICNAMIASVLTHRTDPGFLERGFIYIKVWGFNTHSESLAW